VLAWVCACVRACVRACVEVCVCVCARVRFHVYVCMCPYVRALRVHAQARIVLCHTVLPLAADNKTLIAGFVRPYLGWS